MFRLLDRYFLRETIGPLSLGLLVFTFLALLQKLFQFAELIIERDVEVGVVLRLLGYALPQIVVLTIPMAFLFAILLAVGRMAADSELVAEISAGVRLISAPATPLTSTDSVRNRALDSVRMSR